MIGNTMLARAAEGIRIDDRAVTHGNCQIGKGSKIWQFASIIRGAVLGEACVVGAGAMVDGAIVGDRCHIGAGAILVPGVSIGNDVFIGPGAITCNDGWPSVSKDGFDVAELISGDFVTVRIDDGASIGAGAIILPGVMIGAGAMVAAGAVVNANVPPQHLWKRSGRMCEIDPASTGRRMRRAQCSTS